jgi:hypothetical protein
MIAWSPELVPRFSAVKSDRLLQAGLAALLGFALLTVVHGLVLLGADYRARSARQIQEEAAIRHDAVCEQLGKPRSSPEHGRCLDLLEELRGWHEHTASQQDQDLL